MLKRIKHGNLLLILAVAISFSSCQSKKVNFSVSIPKGWQVFDTVDEAQERLLRIYPTSETSVPAFGENIVIGIIHFEKQREYMERLLNRLKHEVNFYKETGRGVTRVNSFEADWVQYLIQINSQSDTVEQKAYYIESKKCIFQIICSAKPHEIGNISKEIDTVLNSFKVMY
jgi:hypothetical protein